MPIDSDRATFVQLAYRYETVQDLEIVAIYPTAKDLRHDTNLLQIDAHALAVKLFAENGEPAQSYKIEVEGAYNLEDIEGGPIRFTFNSVIYQTDGRYFKCASFEVDYLKNRTTFTVRG
jgi:hypothetical protein